MTAIQVQSVSYKGWLNAVEISNEEIKVIVTPETGRIIFFGFLDAENIFYENKSLEGIKFKTGHFYQNQGVKQAPNIGGNRILPCSEDYFHLITGSRHIPDPFINASAYSVTFLKNGITLKSPISDLLGIQIERTIMISAKGTEVVIKQKLNKVRLAKTKSLDKIPLTIWSLSKIKTPNSCFISLSDDSVFKNGYTISKWPDAENCAAKNISIKNNFLELKSSKNLPQKIGADAKKWVAAYVDTNLFIESFHFDENKKYPDSGTSVTVFGNELFSELECLSPESQLEMGESISYDLQWTLLKSPSKKDAIEFLREF